MRSEIDIQIILFHTHTHRMCVCIYTYVIRTEYFAQLKRVLAIGQYNVMAQR